MAAPENQSVEAENRHHRYSGYRIPWYVHLLWIGFWLFSIWYLLQYFVPALRVEIRKPP